LEIGLGEILGVEAPIAHFAAEVTNGVLEFGASAVVDGQNEGHCGVCGSVADGGIEGGSCRGREVLETADGAELDVVLVKDGKLECEEVFEQVEQGVDLFARTFPVFGGEREEGEAFDAELGTCGGDSADGACTTAVPFYARQTTFGGPASVTVHNDRDMTRHDLIGGGRFGQ
ncbi:MAG: hypothetical protein RIS92_116, partial [Verrucomicrobiota bacterium]